MKEKSACIEQVKRSRTDALLGKKKHYNAAGRKEKYQHRLGLSVIVINIIIGSALFATLKEVVPEWMKWTGAVMALAAAILSALQTYFSFQKAVQGHRRIAGRYLALVKRCNLFLAKYADEVLSDSQLISEMEALAKEIEQVNTEAHSFPTNNGDYVRAKQGMERGEEDYTAEDLERGT